MKEFPSELLHGSGTPMRRDPSRVLVRLARPSTPEEMAALLDEVGLVLEREAPAENGNRPTAVRINHTPDRFWVRDPREAPIGDDRLHRLEEILGDAVARLAPVYQLTTVDGPGGRLCPLPDTLLVRFSVRENGSTPTTAAALARRFGFREDKERSAHTAPFRAYAVDDPDAADAYELRDALRADERVADARLENMPMVVPTTAVPNDTLFAQQWDMTRIAAGGPSPSAWDITTGDPDVVVAVLDSGCSLAHPDLVGAFASSGINLGTMSGTGDATFEHGTECAGIIASRFDNVAGVAGVAGGCSLLPIAFSAWSDVEVLAGINYAVDHGARVVSMSFGQYAPGDGFGPASWDFALIDPAIVNAVTVRDVVLCAATGNENINSFNRYPARHPLVIACGASDEADDRKSPTSPDHEGWGSNWAPGVSVVAPGVHIPTTDMPGPAGGEPGDYTTTFNGTSSATPHVAGLAALLLSQYPSRTNAQVRRIIEQTAAKVGPMPYAEQPGFPSGTRNQAMGYGRIDAFRALDLADMMIRDWPGDDGLEPSSPAGGNFWDFSDIVVRITDDDVFDPADPGRSRNVERGQTNHVYVRVTNNGPRDARNVVVSCRITPYVGLEFAYPHDWTTTDATHVSPAPVTTLFATIPSGGSEIAKFTISPTQVESLWGWMNLHPWHPCLLAEVRADNDYAFASAAAASSAVSAKRNNLAQRNLTVIDVLASGPTGAATWPFVAGNAANHERAMVVSVDRSRLPGGTEVLLSLDDDGSAFPLVDFRAADAVPDRRADDGLCFLEPTRVEASFGCCRGVLTLAAGSRFDCGVPRRLDVDRIDNGEVVIREGKRYARVGDGVGAVHLVKAPGALYPMSLVTTFPAAVRPGTYELRASQLDERGNSLGGATVAFSVPDGI